MGLALQSRTDTSERRYVGLQEEDIYKLPENFFPEMPMCLVMVEMASFRFTP
jgi:hypothetical protein